MSLDFERSETLITGFDCVCLGIARGVAPGCSSFQAIPLSNKNLKR